MNKSDIVFSTLKVPIDFLIIFWSFFIARELRLITDLIPNVSLPIQTIETYPLFLFSIFWWFLYIFLFSTHSLYKTNITNSKIKEFLDIIRYSLYWFVFFSVSVYLAKWIIYDKHEIPRLIIFFTLIIGTVFVLLERIILNNFQYFLTRKWIISKKKLVLVNNKTNNSINYILKDIKKAQVYDLVWYLNKNEIDDFKNIRYIWWEKDFEDFLKKNKCDELLYIDSDFSKKETEKIWDLSRIFWIRYRYITNNFDITNTNTTLSLINSIAVIEINNTPLDSWFRVWKRMFDLFSSIILIILFLPFFLIVWILIKINDPDWPIIYKNKRVWQNWKIFSLYKFRYLKWKYCIKDSYWIKEENDKALAYEKQLIEKSSSRHWPLYKIKNDPRKTSIWKFIEKYSIDELPQLFNVLLWNMSLVWPRPHQPREVSKYDLNEKRLLTIKPWITWMAQVNWREKNSFKDEAKLDIFYIENWSFLLDLKILLKTLAVLTKR